MPKRLGVTFVLGLLLTVMGVLSVPTPSAAFSRPGEPIPTPEQILEECAMKLLMLLEETGKKIDEEVARAERTIEINRRLNAPQKRIDKAAKTAMKRVQGRARAALKELNRIHGTCMINLRRRGSDREQNAELDLMRDDTLDELRLLAFDAYDAIDDARLGIVPEPVEP